MLFDKKLSYCVTSKNPLAGAHAAVAFHLFLSLSVFAIHSSPGHVSQQGKTI